MIKESMAAKDMNTALVDYLILQRHLFEKQVKGTNQNPTRKNVHELRVTVRRIRAALWLIEQGSPRLSFGKLPSSLRKLGQILGEQRELDVAIQDATHYHLKTKKLKSQRCLKKQMLFAKIDSKHRKKTLRDLEKAVRKLQSHPKLNLTVGLARLRERLIPWVRKARINDGDLHELRITAKKARYVLEAIGKPVQPLRNLQGPLGRGHDLVVLQDISGENMKVQSDAVLQYQKARRFIQPTLHFAIKQLEAQI
jgi:CHAD domain-containing protein